MFRYRPAPKIKVGAQLPRIPLWNARNGRLFDFEEASTLMVVVTPTCGPCERLIEAVGLHIGRSAPDLSVRSVFVLPGSEKQFSALEEKGLPTTAPVLLDPTETMEQVWGLNRAPFAFLVDKELIIRAVYDPPQSSDLLRVIGFDDTLADSSHELVGVQGEVS